MLESLLKLRGIPAAKYFTPNRAITRPVVDVSRDRSGKRHSSSSSRPPYDPQATFKFVGPPAPTWAPGDGLPNEMRQWKEEVSNTRRKTWDFTDPEIARNSYRILTSAIIPRPVAFVSTLSNDGIPNLAPFRFGVVVWHSRSDQGAECMFLVLHSVEAFFQAFSHTQQTIVKPPFVRESAVAMECELYGSQDVAIPTAAEPTATFVLGLIKNIHVRDSVLNEDGMTVDPAKLRPISRLGGTTYARLLQGFDIPRISWKAIRDEYQSLKQRGSS
ncbi:hypothetical protein NLJ89_g1126 [Agrocybe chaxingu]|uniref:Flavin reductase like domain-containing protein n=1 Tax=Agrocybe chaxingu TaxID=84603 RepID=A0A9W8N0M7_9AGAR|nr:hypothetical protein NLJ89_g1126 [Agrocybe chaxingu]